MRKRLNNIEALRLLAMLMVVVLHYLDKGGLLTSPAGTFTKSSYMAWLAESFAIVAVNAYVLITGYFMCESTLKLSRLAEIICQVLWYSVLIPVVLVLCGAVRLGDLSTYDFLQFVFPIHMKHYWFVTGYVVLMLFVPFLNGAMKQMSQKQLLISGGLLLIYEMLPKSVLPMKFTFDEAGNNLLWLVCLYITGAYIRKYGIPFFTSVGKSLFTYFGACAAIFGSLLVLRSIYFRADAFGDSLNFAYHYNHILCFAASVALFYAFLLWNMPDNCFSRWIGRIAPYTFGVYLLHEHILVRNLWPQWLRVAPADSALLFVAALFGKCILVLAVGIMTDWVRSLVFHGITLLWRKH